MTDDTIFKRSISKVSDVQVRTNSPKHKAGWVLEPGNWAEYDPFLLLAEDWFEKDTFAMHPHRGMETLTYVIEGKLEHEDNKVGSGILTHGDAQLMTAGSGVMHSEDPPEGETVHTLQLWINLPKENKMVQPRYQNLKNENMPLREEAGAKIRIFSGSSAGIEADTKNFVPLTIVEISLERNSKIIQDLPGDYNGFIFVLEGRGRFGQNEVIGDEGQVLFLDREDKKKQSEVIITSEESLKVLLYAGRPLNEPIVANGPFVMNTEEEIRQAYQDFRNGNFAK